MSVRVEVHTKTGKTLKGEPIGKWPAGAIGEFECWSERWNSIVVIRFFSESGNMVVIPKDSVDYWEIVESEQ